MTSATATRIQEAGQEVFGFEQLFDEQVSAVEGVLEGRDVLAVMPTGSGKSAIYQLAGCLLEGLVLVISPLIALQRDQLERLADLGLPSAALNSTLSETERSDVLGAALNDQLRFLYLAPEQLTNEETMAVLSKAAPRAIAVDEAHCVSFWGHDFRPDYLRIAEAIAALGHPPVLALTATASPPVREGIVAHLRMEEPRVIVGGFDRPNIALEMRRFGDERSKLEGLLDDVAAQPSPGVVYVATRKEAQDISGALWERGVSSVYYHGGMTRSERERAQEAFMESEFDVVVATEAFGMGIDKPDIRFVFHHSMPASIDSLYQEIGRAGRDGEASVARLYYTPGDLGGRRFFAGSRKVEEEELRQIVEEIYRNDVSVSVDELASAIGQPPSRLVSNLAFLERAEVVEVVGDGLRTRTGITEQEALEGAKRAADAHAEMERSRLDMLGAYAETDSCRRTFILNYFGESYDPPCGNCDNCLRGGSAGSVEGPFSEGTRVSHARWGEGTVIRLEEGKTIVQFDSAGYKALSSELVLSEGLLDEATS